MDIPELIIIFNPNMLEIIIINFIICLALISKL
jgi:hypothetical protein